MKLGEIVERLEGFYGCPPSGRRDPFDLIVLENIAYLANDKRREGAIAELKRRVGIDPVHILRANRQTLRQITEAGILPDVGVEKLLTVAKIAYEEFNCDLHAVLQLPVSEAKKALKKFPGIGDPGAEKILLFAGVLPALALESNGLRVLLRLGYGEEDKNKGYSASYRSVQSALADQLPSNCEWLSRAHQLLRQHGKELCKASKPKCESCPLRSSCNYFANSR